VRRCTFEDVSAPAVVLGGTADFAQAKRTRHNAFLLVEDCTVSGPVEFHGSAAIVAGYVRDTLV